MSDPLAAARAAAEEFRRTFRTVILGTASPDGVPDASVAAALLDATGAFVIYVSGLSAHTRNLRANPRASILLAADEAATPNALARRRLSFSCTAEPVSPASPDHAILVAALREKFGATIDVVAALPDFQLLRLIPQQGRLVLGFGAAYDLTPPDWTHLTPVGPPRR